jgi:hypothetical protein
MKIKTGHYYVLADHPGISGFKDWTRKVECIVTAEKARHSRPYIAREYLANGIRQFRLYDGHLPDYQPIAREVEALHWLDANPFQAIVECECDLNPVETEKGRFKP